MFLAFALAALATFSDQAATRHVIPPGREALVSEMLGSVPALPGGCVCQTISIAGDRIVATYACPGAPPAALILRHPGIPGAAVRTKEFGIFLEATGFPAPLLGALRSRMEAGEEGWSWMDARVESPLGAGWRGRESIAVLLAALVAALAIALHVRLDRGEVGCAAAREPPRGPSVRRREALAVAGVLVAALGLLCALLDAPPLMLDSARDLLIAQDLRAGNDVVPVVPTAMPGVRLVHGAPWIRLLAGALALGASLPVIRLGVLVLQALSVALVFHAARRIAGGWAGAAAAALQVALAIAVTEAPSLWNPSILPLPLAIVAVALVAHARGGRPTGALWLAVGLGLAAQIHVFALVLAPIVLFVVTATARRATLGTVAFLAALVAAFGVGNEAALARVIAAAARMPWLAGASIAAGAFGAAARGLAHRTSPERRVAAALLAVAVLPTAATVLLAAGVGHPLTPRYFPALLAGAPLSLATAFWSVTGSSRWRSAATLAVVLAVAGGVVARLLPHRGPRGALEWTLYDAERLAVALGAEGWTWGDLHRHLRSPGDTRALLSAVGAFLPAADAAAPAGEEDLLVVKAREEDVRAPDPGWSVVRLRGGHAAVARRLRPALGWSGAELCVERIDPPAAERCERGSLEPPGGPGFSERAYPDVTVGPHSPLSGGTGTFRARWRVRVAIDAGAASRRIEGTGRVRWQAGLGDEGAGESLTLGPGRVQADVVFSRETRDPEAVAWIPDHVETVEGEERLRGLIAPWRR